MTHPRDDRGTGEPRPAGPGADAEEPAGGGSASVLGPSASAPPAGEAAGADAEGSDAADRVQADFDQLLADAQRERDEYLDLAKRTKADFENYRRRMTAEVEAAVARGRAETIREVVPILDDLERALAAAEIDVAAEATPEEPLAQGVLLVFRGLRDSLAQNGVEAVDPKGEKFDPTQHEALSTQPVDGVEPGVVVEVMQKGYRLGEQLIRPARVVVAE